MKASREQRAPCTADRKRQHIQGLEFDNEERREAGVRVQNGGELIIDKYDGAAEH